MQEVLQQQDLKLKNLAELMPMAVFTTDKEGLITYYNKNAAEFWGRKPRLNDHGEVRFFGLWKLYETDGTLMPQELCSMCKAISDKRSFRNEEIVIERPDGTRINVLINIDPLYDADGNITGAINVFQDITEQKKSDKDLFLLASIVESSDDAIISKTLQGIITSWNRGAERIFGYTGEEIIGKHITVLIPTLHHNEEDLIISKIKSGQKVDHFDTIRITKSGELINVSLTVSPVRNEKGEIIGASKIARDISERVKLDNQLRLYTDKLKEMNSFKDEFMAMASHELKTPLTVIKANLQLLDIKLNQDPNKEFVVRTMNQVNKLSGLISDLLDVSKIQSGNLQLNITEFDLATLITETIENIQQTTQTHKIINSIELNELIVKGDRTRIEQVIVNVLTNALKYSPSGDKIIVEADCKDEQGIIKIKDFGIGIPREDLKKIFSRFYRVKGLASTFSGSGIGLYISQDIIKRHGGKMWVESKENEGSTFYFMLPLLNKKSCS